MTHGQLSLAQQTLVALLFSGILAMAVQIAFVAGHKLYSAREEARAQRVRAAFTDAVLLLLASEADAEAGQTFLAALPSSVWERKIVAELLVMALGNIRGAARDGVLRVLDEAHFAELYLADLESQRDWRRATAAEMLGEMQAHAALPGLQRLLGDEAEEVRLVAGRALGKLGDPQAVDTLLAACARGALPSGVVTQSILRLGRAAVPALHQHLHDTSAEIRALAADLLGQFEDLSAVDALASLLQDAAPVVRISAARSLGRLGDDGAAEALRVTLRDPVREVREAGATALGLVGVAETATPLAEALLDGEHPVRLAAAQALVSLGQPGFEALVAALRAQSAQVRGYAIEALQRSGYADRMARQWLTARQQERVAAAHFLHMLAAAGGMATLEEAGISLAQVEASLAAIPMPARAPQRREDTVVAVAAQPQGKRRKRAKDDVVLVRPGAERTPATTPETPPVAPELWPSGDGLPFPLATDQAEMDSAEGAHS